MKRRVNKSAHKKWQKREFSENSWIVKADGIIKRDYDLSAKNPNRIKGIEYKKPAELVEKWCQLYFYKNKIMAVIKKKCWPEWFEKFVSGERTFELRLADFELKTGDILIMEEYNPETKKCTGRKAEFKCKKVEHSAQDPLQFYKVEDVRKHGFWIIELEK